MTKMLYWKKTITRKNKNKSKGGKIHKNKNKRSHNTSRHNNTKHNTKTLKFKEKLHNYSKLVKLRCSPKEKKNGFSCLEDDTIYKLKELWNARHPDAKIVTNDSHERWEQLTRNMSNVCNTESCWLKQKFVNGKLDKELASSFAPVSPSEWKKNPNEWLSSMDILNVMKQYEKAYKCFDFIGPSPIDFDTHQLYGECVWEELCHFNLENEIKNGKFKIGIIFNLDPHNLGGSHWVSMFINIKKSIIFYFDSAGDEIPKEMMTFVERVKKQGKALKSPINFKFDQNYPVEHQYGDTECGIYSLYFIAHMLEDRHTSEYFKKHILYDKYMEKFRKIYFNDAL